MSSDKPPRLSDLGSKTCYDCPKRFYGCLFEIRMTIPERDSRGIHHDSIRYIAAHTETRDKLSWLPCCDVLGHFQGIYLEGVGVTKDPEVLNEA